MQNVTIYKLWFGALHRYLKFLVCLKYLVNKIETKKERKRGGQEGTEEDPHGLWTLKPCVLIVAGCVLLEEVWLGAQVDLILASFNVDKLANLGFCLPIYKID